MTHIVCAYIEHGKHIFRVFYQFLSFFLSFLQVMKQHSNKKKQTS